MGSLSVTHLLIVLAIVVILFGTKKLRGIGSDIGETVRAFRQATGESQAEAVTDVHPKVARSSPAEAQPPQSD